MTQLAPDGYRNPTLREILKCDRLLMTETLGYLSQGQGSMDEAIMHFVGVGRKDTPQFELLKVVPASLPCKGTDLSIGKAPQMALDSELCKVCGEPKSAHKGGRWCKAGAPNLVSSAARSSGANSPRSSTPPPLPKKVAPGSSKRAASGVPSLIRPTKRGKSSKTTNSHMEGCVASSPTERRNFCYDYHNSKKGCRNSKCQYSHRCPYNVGTVDSPQACDEQHALYNHKS